MPLASLALLVALVPPGLDEVVEATTVAAPPPSGLDREAAGAETLDHLRELIALDTRNPPGNEAVAAAWFDDTLSGVEGIETRVLEVGGGRANFVARLRAGTPRARPVLVLGHMDVVGVQPEAWSTPPLEPRLVSGYLHGRGAIDDKGMLAAMTTVLRALAARRDALQRDVILLATAAEEGGPDVGVDWVLEHHRELLGDPQFALNEGGRIRIEGGRIRTVNVQTTEKVPYDVSVVATGPSGHGSVPLPGNALARLCEASARLHAWRAPLRLNETTRLYFGGLAGIEDDPLLAGAMRTIAESGRDEVLERAAAVLSQTDPLYAAVLRTGQSLTILEGGIRTNVIPSEGRANFNTRVVPGDDVEAVVAAMQAEVADLDVTVALEGGPRVSPPPSSTGTALYGAMERAARTMAPDATVLPFMSTGATDGAALRRAGIPTYGILPMPLERIDELRMHGNDERVPVASLTWATEYLYRILLDVASG